MGGRGPRSASSVRGVRRLRGEAGGRRRVRAGDEYPPVYFIAGKRGGHLKLSIRSLQGWESREGRERFVPGQLELAEAERSIHSLQAPGQPPSPQPRWSSLEGHAAFLGCAPVQRTACNITAWGGDLGGERGREGRGEQVAISSSPLEGAPHASREGPQPPGAENLRPITGEMFVQSER